MTQQSKRRSKQSKDERLLDSFTNSILQYLKGKAYTPSSVRELEAQLHILPDQSKTFRKALKNLVKEDVVECIKKRYSLTDAQDDVITGTLSVHHRGFGFIRPDNNPSLQQDVFIPKHLTKGAVDGDYVEAQIDWESSMEKGPEGKVIAILERGRTHVAGTLLFQMKRGDWAVHIPILGAQQRVIAEPTQEFSLKEGDRFIFKVIEWGSGPNPTRCEPVHLIGHLEDPSCDVEAAVEEFGIHSDFPAKVTAQAQATPTRVRSRDLEGREDFRDWEVFTIDPDTARDFDDALNLHKDSKGHYHLGVHIADVTHYVKPDSPMDKEALNRCNSTYFPGVCIPMLPHELSNNMCSLRPKVNRLTASVLMEFDAKGTLIHSRITRGVIHSKKRFTYREALAVLEGKKRSKHAPTLHLMVELCHLLKKQRSERGSVEFALPEYAVMVNEEGVPTGMDYIEYDITHQLVEEFMIKANEVVARTLDHKGISLPFRVHDEPGSDNIKAFVLLVRAFGRSVSDHPSTQEIQSLLSDLEGSPHLPLIATAYIRTMKMAEYSPNNIGHFGLSLEHYCHFTSPIRRYADLIVHRILFGDAVDEDYLRAVCNVCSEQERLSSRAEFSVKHLKKLRLLEMRSEEDPHRNFDAVITQVKHFGVFFELLDLRLEGFIHVAELGNEYFQYYANEMCFVGERTGEEFRCGQKICVILKELNLAKQETEWEFVDKVKTESSNKNKKKKKSIKSSSKPKKLLRPKKKKKYRKK